MLKQNIQDAINEQINAEIYSSYLYYSMAAYFEDRDLPGLAKWMKAQAQEELVHADKFFNYMVEKDGRVMLKPIEEPPTSWESPVEAFMSAHEHEHIVTDRIHKLVDLANAEGDHATNNLLQWFVAEQVEEESSTWDVVRKLKLVGKDGSGLYMLDREMGQRVFVMPPAQAEPGA